MEIAGLYGSTPNTYLLDGTVSPEVDGRPITNANVAVGQSIQFGVARAGFVLGMTATASAEMTLSMDMGQDNSSIYKEGVGGSFGRFSINPEKIILPKQFLSLAIAGLIRPTDPAGNKIYASMAIRAYKFAPDFDWEAPYRMFVVGDSNTEATAIATPASAMYASGISSLDVWTFKVRKWYRDRGIRVRLIDKSLAGKSSVDFENYRQRHQLDLPEAPHIIFYALGSNDSDATILAANVKKFVAWALTEWTAVKIVIMGPLPRQGMETQMEAKRTAMATAVSEINKPAQVIFINCGLAFDVDDYTQYSGTEANGSGVHVGVKGHESWANYIINKIESDYPEFQTL